MKGIALLATAGLMLVVAPAAHARPGDLDKTFAKTGRFAWNPYGTGGSVAGLTLPDGLRPLLSVSASRNGTYAPSWVRLTSLGRIAEQTPIPRPATGAPALQGDYVVMRLSNQQFTVGKRGGQSVTVTVPAGLYAHNLRVDKAGRAIVVGSRDRGDGTGYEHWAMRFLASGAVDASYGTGGRVVLPDVPNGVLVTPDSRLFTTNGERVTALDAAGRPAAGFVSATFKHGYTLAAGPGETLLVAGTNNGVGYIVRLRSSGRLDTRFGTRGRTSAASVYGRVDPDLIIRDRRGRLLLAGSHYEDNGRFKAAVVRLQARGKVDRTFADRGRKLFGLGWIPGERIVGWTVSHVAIDQRDRILVAGTAYNDDVAIREDFGEPYPAIARLKG
ncbi:putative delta-60 repeat protein [Solirubrobacter pauli]|uniref:Putative delta-60 repeat protein n=1 Tax=Solirubrobacter pauli TaxID=166793 RepID=A0A660L2C9_9ACTN|nr:hypothetical protein [Solirubrobacter pauli]RKQ88151.1 putative delta-60 repeat protein [Solirubrobacter pauli]